MYIWFISNWRGTKFICSLFIFHTSDERYANCWFGERSCKNVSWKILVQKKTFEYISHEVNCPFFPQFFSSIIYSIHEFLVHVLEVSMCHFLQHSTYLLVEKVETIWLVKDFGNDTQLNILRSQLLRKKS